MAIVLRHLQSVFEALRRWFGPMYVRMEGDKTVLATFGDGTDTFQLSFREPADNASGWQPAGVFTDDSWCDVDSRDEDFRVPEEDWDSNGSSILKTLTSLRLCLIITPERHAKCCYEDRAIWGCGTVLRMPTLAAYQNLAWR